MRLTSTACEVSTANTALPTDFVFVFVFCRFMTFYDSLHVEDNFNTNVWILRNMILRVVFLVDSSYHVKPVFVFLCGLDAGNDYPAQCHQVYCAPYTAGHPCQEESHQRQYS